MIENCASPSWKELFRKNEKSENKYIADNGYAYNSNLNCASFLLHRSSISLLLICKWYKSHKNLNRITLWVPEYFCSDTLNFVRDDNVNIFFYPIEEDLSIDIKALKAHSDENKPDIVVGVHYWGKAVNMNDLSVFAKNNDAILVEDAAHILYPYDTIGAKGTFILYSPYKQLPIPDGAVLVVKSDYSPNIVEEINNIKEKIEENSKQINILKWKLKKGVYKLIPNALIPQKIYNKKNKEAISTNAIVEPVYKISSYSRDILSKITYKELQNIGKKRIYNYKYLAYMMEKNFDAIPLLGDTLEYPPHFGVFKLNDKQKNDALRFLNKKRLFANQWPDMPLELIGKNSNCEIIKKNTVIVSVNQTILPQHYQFKNLKYVESNYSLSNVNAEEYEELISGRSFVDLVQSKPYSDAKVTAQNWKCEYFKITNGYAIIAVFQCLIKTILGLKLIRISRGPIFFESIYQDRANVMKLIKNKFSLKHFSVLSILPSLEKNGENIDILHSLGFLHRGFGWCTGFLDLTKTEEELMKNQNSKWRNQLKTCEAKNFIVAFSQDDRSFNEIMEKHNEDMKEKKYKDSGEKIISQLHKDKKLVSAKIYANNELISGNLFAVNNSTVTYFVGWNSNFGRKSNCNNLILWEAVKYFKSKGYKTFDLGGIDFVNTAKIAEFKMGLGCQYKELIGDYFSL